MGIDQETGLELAMSEAIVRERGGLAWLPSHRGLPHRVFVASAGYSADHFNHG